MIVAREYYAGAARKHEPSYATASCGGEKQFGPSAIYGYVGVAIHSNAWQRGCVEDAFNFATSCGERGAIAKIAANHFNASRFEFWICAAAEAAYTISASEQRFDDVTAQKSAAAGHESVHQRISGSCWVAQRVNFSRLIFALWRISTGSRLQ